MQGTDFTKPGPLRPAAQATEAAGSGLATAGKRRLTGGSPLAWPARAWLVTGHRDQQAGAGR
jgi:hypothetical protein